MASTPRKKDKSTSGVRGPGGPQAPKPAGAGRRATTPTASPLRQRFEGASFPLLRTLNRLPRWLIVVLPAVLLLLGLVLQGPWALLGGILLLLVFIMLAWLTALSWPALTPGSRIMRVVVVLALLGITVLKFAGRF